MLIVRENKSNSKQKQTHQLDNLVAKEQLQVNALFNLI